MPIATLATRLSVAAGLALAATAQDNNWPSYHGANGSGIAAGHSLPDKWNIETGENIAWSTEIPGLSHSSPIVYGDRIFVHTAIKQGAEAELKVGLYGDIKSVADDSKHQFQLLCLDRKTGKIEWSKTLFDGVPAIKRHPKGSHAASTPATDGKYVATFFGSEGLFVHTVAGELVWKKSFGVVDSGFFKVPDAQWGWASSPIIHGDRVYVQCDVQKHSFVAAFEVATGKQVWRTARKEAPTWCTPSVHIGKQRKQLILNGWKHMGGYDLDTGKELWKLAGSGDIPVPRPVVAHDMIFLTSAHGGPARIYAISVDAEGELDLKPDGKNLIWADRRFGAYMQSPFVYGDELYVCRDNGVITCWDAKTGAQHYRHRLSAGVGYSSSGVAADGKLFYASEEGDVHVVKAGTEYELLHINEMGETVMATPAITRGLLLIRTRSKLVAVGKVAVGKKE